MESNPVSVIAGGEAMQPNEKLMPFSWPNRPPADCPFPQSTALKGVTFTGRHARYTSADTWYPSWGADDVLYTPWTDGCFSEERRLPVDCSSKASDASNDGRGGRSGTGAARISGDDPLRLSLENLGVEYASPAPYGGCYPCGSLVHNGVWYYGAYCLDESGRRTQPSRETRQIFKIRQIITCMRG
jgi:hypothetical protein